MNKNFNKIFLLETSLGIIFLLSFLSPPILLFLVYYTSSSLIFLFSLLSSFLFIANISLSFIFIKFLYSIPEFSFKKYLRIKKKRVPQFFDTLKNIEEILSINSLNKVFLTSNTSLFIVYNFSESLKIQKPKFSLILGMGLVNSISSTELKALLHYVLMFYSKRSVYYYYLYGLFINYLSNRTAKSTYYNLLNILFYPLFFILQKSLLHIIKLKELECDRSVSIIYRTKSIIKVYIRQTIAEAALNNVRRFYAGKNVKPLNIYEQQYMAILAIAEKESIPVVNGYAFPEINKNYNYSLNLFSYNPLITFNSLQYREEKLKAVNDINSIDTNFANNLFDDLENIQKELSRKYLPYLTTKKLIKDEDFEVLFKSFIK